MLETLAPVTARFQLRELAEHHAISESDSARRAPPGFATINHLCTSATSQVSLKSRDKIICAHRAAGVRVAVDMIQVAPGNGRRGR